MTPITWDQALPMMTLVGFTLLLIFVVVSFWIAMLRAAMLDAAKQLHINKADCWNFIAEVLRFFAETLANYAVARAKEKQ